MASSAPHILFGTGGGIFSNSDTDAENVKELFFTLKSLSAKIYGIDTAARYPGKNPGRSESLLGEAGVGNSGLIVDTKILFFPEGEGEPPLSKLHVLKSTASSLERLKVNRVRCLYCHQPDKVTPPAETVAAFGELYAAGKFDIWGVSNFSPQLLQQFLDECKKQNVPKPILYQGQYNAVCRKIEKSLFPLLRKHGMKFYAYSPTAGGFLTGSIALSNGESRPSRFSGSSPQAERWNERYDKPEINAALLKLHTTAEKHGISLFAASLRWLTYHSQLGGEDGIILGASKISQVVDSGEAIEKGKLPEDVVAGFEELWEEVKDLTPLGYKE